MEDFYGKEFAKKKTRKKNRKKLRKKKREKKIMEDFYGNNSGKITEKCEKNRGRFLQNKSGKKSRKKT